MVNPTLTIESLIFNVGARAILKDITFQLGGSQVVTLLGPNGAGKSTLLKCLAAQRYATSGRIQLNGVDAHKERYQYLPLVGFMPEIPMILSELTVFEQLQLVADSLMLTNKNHAIEQVLETCQLHKVLNKRTTHLSLGYRQRLNLAQAIMAQPQMLIMDEPLNGLDPHLIIELRRIISELKHNTLIIMSTHYLAEAQIISDRVLIMQNGHLLDNIEVSLLNDKQGLEQLYMQHTVRQEVL